MRRYRLWGFGIMTLGLIGLFTWIDALVISNWSSELYRGIGVEVIGALLTALGVIGLDRLYAEPDEQLEDLRKQLEALHAKIDKLQNHPDDQQD